MRKGLRAFASGIAKTGRLAAACLLLAGVLGAGSAIAQDTTTILRDGGGVITLPLTYDDGNNDMAYLQVHHFIAGNAKPVMNPTMVGENNGTPPDVDGIQPPTKSQFLIGNLANVTLNDTDDDLDTYETLTIEPIPSAAGSFKIVLAPDGEAGLDAMVNKDKDKAHLYVVMSANSPSLVGIEGGEDGTMYNTNAAMDITNVTLTRRDAPTKEQEKMISGLFEDADDVSLSYSTQVDLIERGTGDDKKKVSIVTASISGEKLTLTLTDKATVDGDMTHVTLIATDAAGEYAWKRYEVTVGAPTQPYVTEAGLGNKTYREDDKAADIMAFPLAPGFDDPDLTADTNNDNETVARTLEIKVTIDDMAAQRVPEMGADFTWITTPMNIVVTGDGTDAPTVKIEPRAKGMVTFTVTATDKGAICKGNGTDDDDEPVKKDDDDMYVVASLPTDADATLYCVAAGTTLPTAMAPDKKTDKYPDSKSTKTTFTVTIQSKTTPQTDNAIPALTLVSDKDVGGMTVDLADVDSKTEGAQAAFKAHGQELTYTVTLPMEKTKVAGEDIERPIADVSEDGGKITVVPIWRQLPDVTKTATVTATNGSGESVEATFDVTVKAAEKPIVNPFLADTIGDTLDVMVGSNLVIDLKDVRKVIENDGDPIPIALPVFIDPNATEADLKNLPAGLQLHMNPEDVMTAHRYDDQSSANDVYTSMGRIMLDPKTGVLTLNATAPNNMTVTVHATDRERNMTSATMVLEAIGTSSAEGDELPTEVSLSQNYPNPFNPQTTIEYALPAAGDVTLIVYDMLGREVTTLLNGPQTAGRHTVNFDAAHLSNGTYVYRLVAPNKTITRTMVLVK